MLSYYCMDNIKHQIIVQITDFLAGELPPARLESLQQWVAASDENRRYFEEMKAIWQLAGSVDASGTFHSEKALKKVAGKMLVREYVNRRRLFTPTTQRIIRRTMQVAAAVAAIFFGGAWAGYMMVKPGMDRGQEMTMPAGSKSTVVAPRGAKSTIALPDGSKVVLNAASKISYASDYGWSSREISLEGEAYFDVKTNPQMPFVVHTSHLDIQAFGTAFNVKAYPEDLTIETTLEHGEVKIRSRNDHSVDLPLKPKQNVVYYKNENRVAKQTTTNSSAPSQATKTAVQPVTVTDQVNVDLYTSWKDTEWLIESKSFGELAGLLERRYDIRIMFGSNDIKNYRFSGTIRNETIEQVLNAMTLTAPLKYSINQGVVRLVIDPKRKSNYDALSR